jgi:HD-like signal output (HDOD) protein
MQHAQRPGRTHDVLGEIGTKGDFPAAAHVVERLNGMLRRDDCSALVIAQVILQDPGLSSKVLRVVNSAFYRTRGNPISTITRAVILLGVERVRDVAASLLLIEQVIRHARASAAAREHLHRSLLCALLSQELAVKVNLPAPEEAYLLGLFSNLGLLWLAAFYEEEFEQALERESGKPLEQVVAEVFGVTTRELAAHVLEHWNFPVSYTNHFRRPLLHDAASMANPTIRLSTLVGLVAEFVRGSSRAGEKATTVLTRFQSLFAVAPDEFLEVAAKVTLELRKQEAALGIEPAPEQETAARSPVAAAPADRLAAAGAAHDPAAGALRDRPADGPAASALRPVAAEKQGAVGDTSTTARPAPAVSVEAALAMVAEITRSIIEHDDINQVLLMVLEATARTGGFDAVFLALRSFEHNRLVGRMGYGAGVEDYLKDLAVPLQADSGILAATALRREPHLVADGRPDLLVPPGAPVPRIASRSFVAQPLVVRGKAIGVLFAGRAGTTAIGPVELALVQAFASQATLALSQHKS